jgi:hypothetical protein
MAIYSLGIEVPANTTAPVLLKKWKGVGGVVTKIYVDVSAGVGYMAGFFIDYAGVRFPSPIDQDVQYFSGDDSEYWVQPFTYVGEGDVAIYGMNFDNVPHRFWLIIEVQEEGYGV